MNDVPLSPRLAWPVTAGVCIVLMLACSGCFSAFPTSLTGTSGAQPLVTSGGYSSPAAYDTTAAVSGGSCRQGLTSCGGNCVDTGVDIGNCGGCDMACPSNAACRNSQCYCKDGYEASGSACVKSTAPAADAAGSQDQPGGYVCEDPSLTLCGEYCIDATSDPGNCSACSNACAAGEQCSGGQCVGGSQQPPAVQQPVRAILQSMFGQSSALQRASQIGGKCDVGSWCPNMCTNLEVDYSNCGKCGNPCKDNEACVKGVCTQTSCKNHAWSCSGHCALLNGDMPPLNCGGCGRACSSGQLCYSGICKDFTSTLPSGTHVCGKYFACKQGNDDPCKEMDTTTTFCGYGKTLADGGTLPFLNCCSSGQSCVSGQCQTRQMEVINKPLIPGIIAPTTTPTLNYNLLKKNNFVTK